MQQTQFESKHNLVNLSPRLQTWIYVPLIFSLEGFCCREFAAPSARLCFAFRFTFFVVVVSFFQPAYSLFLLLLYLSKTTQNWRTSPRSSQLVDRSVGVPGPAAEPLPDSPRRKHLQDDVTYVQDLPAGCPQQIWEARRKTETTGRDLMTQRYQSPSLLFTLSTFAAGAFCSVSLLPAASSLRQLPAPLPICRRKFAGHHFEERARRRAHARHRRRGNKLFQYGQTVLFGSPLLAPSLSVSLSSLLASPLSRQQMGYFNEISLACSHLCEK